MCVCLCENTPSTLYKKKNYFGWGGGGLVVIFKPTIFSCLCNN